LERNGLFSESEYISSGEKYLRVKCKCGKLTLQLEVLNIRE
jgi:hypothetical protein